MKNRYAKLIFALLYCVSRYSGAAESFGKVGEFEVMFNDAGSCIASRNATQVDPAGKTQKGAVVTSILKMGDKQVGSVAIVSEGYDFKPGEWKAGEMSLDGKKIPVIYTVEGRNALAAYFPSGYLKLVWQSSVATFTMLDGTETDVPVKGFETTAPLLLECARKHIVKN